MYALGTATDVLFECRPISDEQRILKHASKTPVRVSAVDGVQPKLDTWRKVQVENRNNTFSFPQSYLAPSTLFFSLRAVLLAGADDHSCCADCCFA